ncbi:unnamed protein product [Orchesella dallaii]|uniref:Metalloendopeptidase n=1 Tax=Orchesella dallaii TaxID=48710 RepID=A0ABP1PHD5_9HEXA
MAQYLNQAGKLILILICIQTIILKTALASFSCQTPEPSESDESFFQYGNQFQSQEDGEYFNRDTSIRPWANNIVKYSIDRSLNAKDRRAVTEAIQDYHTKTCIKFQPKSNGDRDFVHIEIKSDVCGYAIHLNSRRKVVQMGKHCRNKHTMVHEFGHTLGLDHEHQRRDRNDYISYRQCQNHDKILKNSRPVGFYDYQSVMHYECGKCDLGGWPIQGSNVKCGEDFSDGLSVLDTDHLNSMHNCDGCRRHRWRPANQLTSVDRSNLHSFGYTNPYGKPVYPCRSLLNGQVVLGHGSFGDASASCIVIQNNKAISINSNVEVLTIPGGLRQQCFTYILTSHTRAFVNEAIPAAAKNYNAQSKVYIAYGTGTTRAIGEVTATNSFAGSAQFVATNGVTQSKDYDVLTCSCSSGQETYYPPAPLPTTYYPAVAPTQSTTATVTRYIPTATTPQTRTIPRRVSYGAQPTNQGQPTAIPHVTPTPRYVSYTRHPTTNRVQPTTTKTSYIKTIPRRVSYGQTSINAGKNNHLLVEPDEEIRNEYDIEADEQLGESNSWFSDLNMEDDENLDIEIDAGADDLFTSSFDSSKIGDNDPFIESDDLQTIDTNNWLHEDENRVAEMNFKNYNGHQLLSELDSVFEHGLTELDTETSQSIDEALLEKSSNENFFTEPTPESNDNWLNTNDLLDNSRFTKGFGESRSAETQTSFISNSFTDDESNSWNFLEVSHSENGEQYNEREDNPVDFSNDDQLKDYDNGDNIW